MDKEYIVGKFTRVIYQSESGYAVTLFRVSKSSSISLGDLEGSTIHATGIIPDIKEGIPYKLYGNYVKHQKYSWQYAFDFYEVDKPTSKDSMIEFLTSSFVEGCGKTTAKNIVDMFGVESLDKIKEGVDNLLKVKGMTASKALKIYNSVLNFEKNDGIVLKLNNLGFSMDEAARIFNKHQRDISLILEGNFYLLKDIIDFKRLDNLYTTSYDPMSPLRVKECILSSCMERSFEEGSTYYMKDEIYEALLGLYKIALDGDAFDEYLDDLIKNGYLVNENNTYYLKEFYDDEKDISIYLKDISEGSFVKINELDEKIKKIEIENGFIYNEEQIKAIKDALNNNITIISGGPGTGKTTIIKAIVKLYIDYHHLNFAEIASNIALLAPTGRAAKKLSSSTGLPAYTIHRFLKWHKDSNEFEYNSYNKLNHQ